LCCLINSRRGFLYIREYITIEQPRRVSAKNRIKTGASAATSPPFRRRKTASRLLDDVTEREQRFLVEGPPDQLQRQWQSLRVLAGRQGDSRQARHVHRHGEDVVQIHLDRIGAALLAEPEGGRRRGRRQNRVDAPGEAVLEILLDQRSDLLRAQVIGI